MNVADKFNHTLKLLEWGADESSAELILDCIKKKRNILITGAVAVGKTLFLKELISMTDQATKFGYLYRRHSGDGYGDYELHPVDAPRVAGAANMARVHLHNISIDQLDFFVVDDVYPDDFDEITDFLNNEGLYGTLGTCFLRNRDDAKFVFNQQRKYYDLMIYLQGYQRIDKVVLVGR